MQGGHRKSAASSQIHTWADAEANAAKWMRRWGFKDASVTGAGADGGVDVRARGALAQVKFQASQVSRPDLQRLVGARGRELDATLLFFAGTGYSASAVEYAEMMDIALFVYSLDGSVRGVNDAARRRVSRWTRVGERERAEAAAERHWAKTSAAANRFAEAAASRFAEKVREETARRAAMSPEQLAAERAANRACGIVLGKFTLAMLSAILLLFPLVRNGSFSSYAICWGIAILVIGSLAFARLRRLRSLH